ncbi:nucleotide-binding alpha-beta plait domain-containing protein [Artemisia annua]|uniref:Nucleotide-binding alpha-beta plait domain-containing protein n=1 Tax=Artemisia annua TaxID=35608 RepID=A0A2U1P7U0_ARTAN|nr:nucleotide-binding alpha-beta plait domain-containing protein [Artemisia annua]
MRDKATSFFFTNFPETWDSTALWKMFDKYGKVVDVYIAFKRTKRGTRFGFVRFINIGDVGMFERRLKGIIIGNSNLVINKAKYIKVGDKGVPAAADFPPFKQGNHHTPKMSKPTSNYSFKEAVLGHNTQAKPRIRKIHIEENAYLRSKLECCWIGEAKNFHVLQNAWSIVHNNGLDGCNIKYLGGLSFIFEWGAKDVAIKSLEENKVWLHQWFDNIKLWDNKCGSYGRLAWLNIDGLPTLGRDINSVKAITKEFGRSLEVCRLDFDSKILPPVKALVHLPNMNRVTESLMVVLNGVYYPVTVFEEQFNTSSLLSPHSSDSKGDSVFEEVFIGPSLARNGFDGDLSGQSSSEIGDSDRSGIWGK